MSRRPYLPTKRQDGASQVIARMFSDALRHHQAGRVAEAEDLCRKILAVNPRHPDSLHLLGMIAFQGGLHERAEEMMRESLAINAEQAAYHSNLGAVLQAQGRLEEAVDCYERAVALKPDYVEALYRLGLAVQLQGQLERAARYQERVLGLRPDHAEACFSLGQMLHGQGRLDEAVARYERAIALRPNHAKALNNLGTIFQAQRKLEDAAGCYERVLALAPEHVNACKNLGDVLLLAGKHEAAIAQYLRALALTPDSAEVHSNLGLALARQGKVEVAIVCLERALQLKPDYAEACNNLGQIRELLGDFDGPASQYKRALQLKPDYAEAAFNQSLLELLAGDFSMGLRTYERRWGVSVKPHNFSQPQWRGEPLHGARILLHAEQGLGDTLQFLRYVPMVQAAGGSVVLAVQSAVRRLAAKLPGGADMVASGDAVPEVDWQCPLLSLPLAFGTTLDTIPGTVPYLSVPEEALQKAATVEWPAVGLRVGIVWAGNAAHAKDRYRSLPLTYLEPLLRTEGVHFFSLQMGPEAAQLAAIQVPVTNLGHMIGDMADTAALIQQLDLVIAVDTSVVHLAGALGKPVWLMLPFSPDWRWRLDREDSPWYPTMRLFRQPKFDDWHSVVKRVCAALRNQPTSYSPSCLR
jgi:tetratricopeptide (TPR) repeat protein